MTERVIGSMEGTREPLFWMVIRESHAHHEHLGANDQEAISLACRFWSLSLPAARCCGGHDPIEARTTPCSRLTARAVYAYVRGTGDEEAEHGCDLHLRVFTRRLVEGPRQAARRRQSPRFSRNCAARRCAFTCAKETMGLPPQRTDLTPQGAEQGRSTLPQADHGRGNELARRSSLHRRRHPGWTKADWLRHVLDQVAVAEANGADIVGVCWYPVIDSPPWDRPRSRQRWSHGLIRQDGSVDEHLALALVERVPIRQNRQLSLDLRAA